MIQEGFRLGAVAPSTQKSSDTTNYQVQHSPRVLLIDAEGMVRGTYNAAEPDAIARVEADIAALGT